MADSSHHMDEAASQQQQQQQPQPQPTAHTEGRSGKRPGDWTCVQCSNLNYVWREQCNRCRMSKSGNDLALKYGAHTPDAPDSDWYCFNCNQSNYARRDACHKCNAQRTASAAYAIAYAVQATQNAHLAAAQAPVAASHGKASDWTCLQCGNVNFHFRSECNRCHQPRSASEGPGDKYGDEVKRGRTPSQLGGMPVGFYQPQMGGVPMQLGLGMQGGMMPPMMGRLVAPMLPLVPQQHAPHLGHPSQSQRRPGGPPQVGVDGNWQCQSCGNANWAKRDRCNRCQAERTQEQDAIATEALARLEAMGGGGGGGSERQQQHAQQGWPCPQCGNLNYAFRTQCNRCHAERPDHQQ